jgi:hypothetical protein
MIPVYLPNDLPSPAIEVVPALLADQVTTLVAQADACAITDATSCENANALVLSLHQLDKDVIAHGDRIKKPLNNLLKAVRDCLDRAVDPVQAAKKAVQVKIAAWNREQQRIADEAKAKAEAEARAAREAAEKERQRLQAEADAKHAAEVAAATAKAKQEAEELAAVLGAPVEAAKVELPPAPVVEVAPVVVAPVVVAEVPKSAVTMRKIHKVEITDPSAVPVAIGGFELRPIDNAALRKALDAGLVIAGARIIEVEEVAMARGVK